MLSATEYGMKDCFLMLNQVMKELKKNKFDGVAFFSIDQLPTKLSLALIFLILLFLSPDSYNRLLLSISTLILTYVQIKSGKRFLSSLGWSVAFLSLGLIFGGLIETNSLIQEVSTNSLSQEKIQSIPAILILWLGIVFL